MKYYTFLFLLLLLSCNQETKQNRETAISQETQTTSQNVEEQKADNSSQFGPDENDRHADVFKDITLEDGIWFSEAFQETLDKTFNIDSALKTEPYPFVYFSFTGEEWELDAFDFTEHMVGWQPREILVLDSVLYGNNKKEYMMYTRTGQPKGLQVDRVEVIYKDDYDEDKDGESDDKNTVEIKKFYKDKLLSTKNYYRTHRSPSEIANYSLLWGKYKDAKGDLYEFSSGKNGVFGEKFKVTKTYLGNQDLYQVPVYSLRSPILNLNYVLQADEGGNDYLITTNDKAFPFIRTRDSLLLVQGKNEYIRLKKVE